MGCDDVWVQIKNIQAMKDWPCLKNLKSLRWFLGLIGYYMKFVHNHGKISRPLTRLLNKSSISWDDPVEQDFISLNNAMCSNPILAMPNFSKPFVLECDALGIDLGEVLTQEGRSLAYTSK